MTTQSKKNTKASGAAKGLLRTFALVAAQKAIENELASDANYVNLPTGKHQFANISLTVNMPQVEITQLAPFQRPDNVNMPWSTIIALLLMELPEDKRKEVQSRIINFLKVAHEMQQNITEISRVEGIKKEIEDAIHFWKQELHHKMPPRTIKGPVKPVVLGSSFTVNQ